jgi:hypothetical protein
MSVTVEELRDILIIKRIAYLILSFTPSCMVMAECSRSSLNLPFLPNSIVDINREIGEMHGSTRNVLRKRAKISMMITIL